jgi:hypothetical protein
MIMFSPPLVQRASGLGPLERLLAELVHDGVFRRQVVDGAG